MATSWTCILLSIAWQICSSAFIPCHQTLCLHPRVWWSSKRLQELHVNTRFPMEWSPSSSSVSINSSCESLELIGWWYFRTRMGPNRWLKIEWQLVWPNLQELLGDKIRATLVVAVIKCQKWRPPNEAGLVCFLSTSSRSGVNSGSYENIGYVQ